MDVPLAGSANSGESSDESQLLAVFREQLAAERQAHAEARRIIAGLVERIPAIEAPAQTPEAYDEAAEEASGRVKSQEGEQRPWWKRVFRG